MNCDFVLTTCPFCGCGCQFYLQALDGEVTEVIPCKTDPISEGKLCIKGRKAHKFIHHHDRLTTPLIKENGQFRPASWEEALDVIRERLEKTRQDYGPDALSFLLSAKCTNEENFLFMKFARAVIGTNNIDHCARLCHASTVLGLIDAFGSGAMSNSVPKIEGADCIFVIGSNTIEQHHLVGTRIMRAKEKGSKLIVADPRRTPLTNFSDIHLQIKSGTDICLLNGLGYLLLKEGLIDQQFIAQRTEGFEAYRDKISEYTPEKVANITGIEQKQLERAARAYGEAEKASIVYCMGITQHVSDTDNVRDCANLALLTGNVGRESTGVNPLRGQNNVQGACDMGALPNVYSGYQSVEDRAAVEKFGRAWKASLPTQPGLTIVEMIEAAREGSIKEVVRKLEFWQ